MTAYTLNLLDGRKESIEGETFAKALSERVKTNANLYHTNLYRADLEGADLEGADLEGASLYRANLRGANLRGANLIGVDIRCASFHGARWGDRELSSIKPILLFGAVGSENRNSCAVFFEGEHEPLIQCGCFKGTLSEFEAKVQQTHGGTRFEAEYLDAIAFVRAFEKRNRELQAAEASEVSRAQEGGAE